MKKSMWLLIFCFLPAVSVFLSAQTAVEIEELLKTETLSYGEAALFVLKAAEVSEPQNPAEAFSFAAERKWLPGKAVSGGKASLDGVSLLIMRSFGKRGGIFYSLFKNPHYAYREMVYQDIIQGRTDPKMTVSGELLLFLLSRVFSLQEDGIDPAVDWGSPEPPAAQGGQQEWQAPREPEIGEPQHTDAQPALVPMTPVPHAAPVTPQRAAEQQALVEEINTQLEASAIADASARVTNEGVTISLSNIQFLANSAELPETEKSKLQEIARILQTVPGRIILVTGHTALAGTEQDRLQTSNDRAKAVAAYLISLGARRADEIYAQGLGAEQPIAANNTPEGMALNRRVEITILENQ